MSELSQQERDHLATVMGWVRWGDYWGDPKIVGSGQFTVKTWTPDKDIVQAMMLVADDDYEIFKEGSIVSVQIYDDNGLAIGGYQSNKSPEVSYAICRAKLAEIGYEEE